MNRLPDVGDVVDLWPPGWPLAEEAMFPRSKVLEIGERIHVEWRGHRLRVGLKSAWRKSG